jgi:hypothetical protein
MALPVGDRAAIADAQTGYVAREEDALRLRSILSLGASLARSLHEDATRSASTPGETFRDWSEGAEQWLGEEIERLWVHDGAHGAREVRLKLSETVIPGTWLRITEHAGDLLVELSSVSDGTCHWLCKAASRLAVDVSERLRRSVRVVVFDRDMHQVGVGHACYSDGETL